jgi:hypothetical protein
MIKLDVEWQRGARDFSLGEHEKRSPASLSPYVIAHREEKGLDQVDSVPRLGAIVRDQKKKN